MAAAQNNPPKPNFLNLVQDNYVNNVNDKHAQAAANAFKNPENGVKTYFDS